MTPTTIPQQQRVHERRSAFLVICILAISLFLGWQVKTAVQNASRSIEHGGFTANIPDGWLVQDGAGDLIFVARNPQALDHLYRVSQIPVAEDIGVLAENRNLARARLDDTYRVLTAEPILFAGRDAYKVTFARADTDSPGMPHIIEGLDYYFVNGDQVNILSLEAQSEAFAAALPGFQAFVQSVTYSSGE